MGFIRNSIGVILGLLVSGTIIHLGIRYNPYFGINDNNLVFGYWGKLLFQMKDSKSFFLYLLFLSGISASLGGVATAVVVAYAKVAYAILIGFILLFVAMLDVIITPYHPTFYKIFIFLTFFPFSWIGGKITEVLFERKSKLPKA